MTKYLLKIYKKNKFQIKNNFLYIFIEIQNWILRSIYLQFLFDIFLFLNLSMQRLNLKLF